MLKLNKKIEYALIALKHMRNKHQGELTTAKEIAETYGCPFDAVARVMQQMVQGNILNSSQGAMGGYHIAQDLNRFSMNDLLEMLVGPIHVTKCLNDDRDCGLHKTCNIISPITLLNKKITEFYRTLNLMELIEASIRETPFRESLRKNEVRHV